MSSYQQLAGAYDELTWDVGYEKRADFLEKLFRRSRIPVHTVQFISFLFLFGINHSLFHRVHDLAAGRAGL